jgi:hypothetical protein
MCLAPRTRGNLCMCTFQHPLPCPSISLTLVYICTHIFQTGCESWLCITATECCITFSRAGKGCMLSCQIKSLPKWSKLIQRFVNYSQMDEMGRMRMSWSQQMEPMHIIGPFTGISLA